MNTPMPVVVPVWRKWWLKSKTALFGIATVIAGLWNEFKPYVDDLRSALGPHWFAALLVAVGVTTIYLRHKTAGGLSLTKDGES